MAAVFGDFGGDAYYYTARNSRGKKPGSDTKNEPTTPGMPVLSTTSSWISNRSKRRGPKTETPRSADVTCKSSNTPAVVPETETVATAKSEADTAVVHDQVLGITHVIAANPDGCHEQLVDALRQVWVEPVCFINVSAENHARVLEHMDALTFSNYHTKMSYFPHRMILIIYSPLPVHEETTSEMSFTISHALHSIQYNRTLLKTSVLTNSRMYSEHLFTIPDMQVTMKPTTTTAAETQLLWMAESGFTQSRVAIMTKMEDTLLSHEELLLILMILVKERKKYASPAANSVTWNQTREEGSVRTYSEFAPERTSDKLFGPVIAMGHEWIDIESVDYFVWVKSGDQRIDLAAPPTAHGTLFPNIDMDNVTDALNHGLDLVKATMSSTLDLIEPSVNHRYLLTPSALTFNWELDSSSMSVAVYETAHARYCDWYRRQFSGTKRRRVDNPTTDENTRPSIRRALSSGHVQADNQENAKSSISSAYVSDTSDETVSSSELATPGTESSSGLSSDDSNV